MVKAKIYRLDCLHGEIEVSADVGRLRVKKKWVPNVGRRYEGFPEGIADALKDLYAACEAELTTELEER